MDVPSRSETIEITTTATVGGAVGGALGALAGTAAVWLVILPQVPEAANRFPLAGAQEAMAMVVTALVAVVLGILIGMGLGMAFGTMSWDLLDGKGLALLVIGCLLAEVAVLVALRGMVASRDVGMTNFVWTGFVPGLCASPLPALALMALAIGLRRAAS
jgi:hypothetical protein